MLLHLHQGHAQVMVLMGTVTTVMVVTSIVDTFQLTITLCMVTVGLMSFCLPAAVPLQCQNLCAMC